MILFYFILFCDRKVPSDFRVDSIRCDVRSGVLLLSDGMRRMGQKKKKEKGKGKRSKARLPSSRTWQNRQRILKEGGGLS